MNRYRLNQILEILLFPFCDPELGKMDYLELYYEAYHNFVKKNGRETSLSSREELNKKYKQAEREFISYLADRNGNRIKSYDDILMLCKLYYPFTEMEDVICRVAKRKEERGICDFGEGNISIYYFRLMSKIARSLVTYRDGVAAIRNWSEQGQSSEDTDIFETTSVFNKVEIWNLLCRFTVPDIYIAVFAVESNSGTEALFEQGPNLFLADKLLAKYLNRGLAENHLHFNVGYHYGVMWLYYMELDYKESDKWKEENWRFQTALFRCMAALFIRRRPDGWKGDFMDWLTGNACETVREAMKNIYQGKTDMVFQDAQKEEILSLYSPTNRDDAVPEYDYLLDCVYHEFLEYKTSSEFFLLYDCYRYVKEHSTDTFFAGLFLQYLRRKNDYFRKMQQRHVVQGLRYFQRVYDSARHTAREALKESLMLEVFRTQGQIGNLKKLEIRVAPVIDAEDLNVFCYEDCKKVILSQLYQQIYDLFYVYKRYILERMCGVYAAIQILEDEDMGREVENCRCEEKALCIPTLGIVFHFLKRDSLDDVSGYFCWRNAEYAVKECALDRMTMRYLNRNIALALEEIRGSIPFINEYIVGIDAASDENAMEPWMFAQTYRTMRSRKSTRPVRKKNMCGKSYERIQNVGFTYHVGEDFRHILSGLRHVDEVIEEFGYKPGDRLGHALALGVDISQWIYANEVVPMPLQEQMENLLWVWGKNANGELFMQIQLEMLEKKIKDIAEKIFPHPETITVRMLYQAYKMKFSSNHYEIASSMAGSQNDTNSHSYCYYDKDENKIHGWTAEKLLLTNYCPVFREKFEQIEMLAVSIEDLELYQTLQENLIQRVERLGIYIETNPTSNLTIGDFSYMRNHPIFNLSRIKEDGHHVLVTVNSDDPAVFNTNIENELAYIYYAAAYQNYSKEEILDWIDRIRQNGMDASFVRNIKEAGQILSEINVIMKTIRDGDYLL